jgi:hypothetical protein
VIAVAIVPTFPRTFLPPFNEGLGGGRRCV